MDRDLLGAIAAVVVGAVFLLSSISKLAAPAQWRTQSAAMGVSGPVAAVVPLGEAVLAAWLVVQWHRHAAAWCAVAVLAVFTAFLGRLMAQGRRPPCACFGGWSTKPVGPGHLVRNGLFIALAVAAAVL